MTERFPLSVTSTDPFERALLGSVRRDQPGPQALQRTATALGLGASTIMSVGTATGTATGALGGAVATSGAAAASLSWSALKAVALGALCGSVAVLGVKVATPLRQAATSPSSVLSPIAKSKASQFESLMERGAEPSPAASSAQQQRGFSEVAAAKGLTRLPAAAQPASGDIPHPTQDVVVNLEPPGARLSTAPAAAAATVLTHTTIAEEIASIDRARLSIRTGKAREALNELEYYQSRWPRGVFATECVILRVESKLVLGDRAGAERDANVMLTRQPNGRYAARLRALVAHETSGHTLKSSEP